MNYNATLLLLGGGVITIVGIRGTYKQIWSKITGSPYDTNTPAAIATPQQIDSRYRPQGTYQAIAAADATAQGIDPALFVKQIQQESGFNPAAVSSAGAEGIAQFMPATAKGLGIDPLDPAAALKAAAALMKSYISRFGGSEAQALSSYNAGEGATLQAIQSARNHGGQWYEYIPAETRNYIQTIEGSWN